MPPVNESTAAAAKASIIALPEVDYNAHPQRIELPTPLFLEERMPPSIFPGPSWCTPPPAFAKPDPAAPLPSRHQHLAAIGKSIHERSSHTNWYLNRLRNGIGPPYAAYLTCRGMRRALSPLPLRPSSPLISNFHLSAANTHLLLSSTIPALYSLLPSLQKSAWANGPEWTDAPWRIAMASEQAAAVNAPFNLDEYLEYTRSGRLYYSLARADLTHLLAAIASISAAIVDLQYLTNSTPQAAINQPPPPAIP
jgi:hypothetical protein